MEVPEGFDINAVGLKSAGIAWEFAANCSAESAVFLRYKIKDTSANTYSFLYLIFVSTHLA